MVSNLRKEEIDYESSSWSGLDVSSGESEVQAFLDKGKPYGKSFKVSHTNESLAVLFHFLKKVENESRTRCIDWHWLWNLRSNFQAIATIPI